MKAFCQVYLALLGILAAALSLFVISVLAGWVFQSWLAGVACAAGTAITAVCCIAAKQ